MSWEGRVSNTSCLASHWACLFFANLPNLTMRTVGLHVKMDFVELKVQILLH